MEAQTIKIVPLFSVDTLTLVAIEIFFLSLFSAMNLYILFFRFFWIKLMGSKLWMILIPHLIIAHHYKSTTWLEL